MSNRTRHVLMWIIACGLGLLTPYATDNPSGLKVLLAPALLVIYLVALIFLIVRPRRGAFPSALRMVLAGILILAFSIAYIFDRDRMLAVFDKVKPPWAFGIYLAVFLGVVYLVKHLLTPSAKRNWK